MSANNDTHEDSQGLSIRAHNYRPEVRCDIVKEDSFGIIKQPITLWQIVSGNNVARKLFILILLGLLWEGYGVVLNNTLIFPTFSETISALYNGITGGSLLARAWMSIKILLMGYATGLALAVVLTVFAITTRIGRDFLEVITSMFNPLPAIALLPLALLWFGLGNGSLIFVLVHSVLWAISLNMLSGFQSVSLTLRMVGRNYGLTGLSYVSKILVPAAFPTIVAGLKIGWAFAWRTLIAAELVFGVSSGGGGLGWYIFENKNMLDIPNVFAGLLLVILIGLFVENFIFRIVERHTIEKWGMQG